MTRGEKITLALSLIVFVYWALGEINSRPIKHRPGILVTETPTQTDYQGVQTPVEVKQWHLTPLAHYLIRARVLSTHRYGWFDHGHELAPIDFAVGWKSMSDTAVTEKLKISQSVRYYSYSWRDQPPIPLRDIQISSANMHLIPANEYIREFIAETKVGQVVTMEGELVEVSGPGGFRWRSSLTREDTGNGACELMLVKDIRSEF